jgi:hypothetical protein
MKVSTLDKDKKTEIENQVESMAGSLGLGDMWTQPGLSERRDTGLKNMVGLCSMCTHLNYCKGEYGTVHAHCEEYGIRLTGRERVKECTKYARRGQMLLSEALQMAHIIEVGKREIGF